jgi:hypothetical protein
MSETTKEEPFFGENIRSAVSVFKNIGKKPFIPPCMDRQYSLWTCECGWANATADRVISCHDKPEYCSYHTQKEVL